MVTNSKLLPIEPAHSYELAAKLAASDRLRGKPVELIYPGSGWDFKSFWMVADPARAVLVDPAPAMYFDSPHEGLAKWRSQLIAQLGPLVEPVLQIVYDLAARSVREIPDQELRKLTGPQCSEDGTLRLAFSARVSVHERDRIISLVAARFEEIPDLSTLNVPDYLRDIATLNTVWPIVYEHKSMVSTPILEKAIAPGGCLIWGLPDDAPKVQWLSMATQSGKETT